MFLRRRNKKPGIFKRLLRSIFAVCILTAFVLGVAFLVKGMSELNVDKFTATASPLFNKLGLNEKAAGEVAGDFISRVANTGFKKDPVEVSADETFNGAVIGGSTKRSAKVASIAIMADNGDEFDVLQAGVKKATELNVDYIFHLGDLTDWGDVDSLKKAKAILDSSGVKWYAIPGDHDLAQSVGQNKEGDYNFLQVFGKNYTKVSVAGSNIILLDNSANFTPMSEERFTWFLNEIDTADFVFLSQPLYHPFSSVVMGKVDGKEQKDLYNQASIMLSKVRNSSTKAIFSAAHHISSGHPDAERTSLMHYVVGALSVKRNPQITPRFYVLTLYENGDYSVDEILTNVSR
jgi:calcineurin-like phosphoesterase family protein